MAKRESERVGNRRVRQRNEKLTTGVRKREVTRNLVGMTVRGTNFNGKWPFHSLPVTILILAVSAGLAGQELHTLPTGL